MEFDFNFVLSIIAGLGAAIPLVLKLVEYVQKAAKEKNWNQLLHLVMALMAEAESKFEAGDERKEWVLGMVNVSAKNINYDVDIGAVSELIDNLCAMSKQVNAPEGLEI